MIACNSAYEGCIKTALRALREKDVGDNVNHNQSGWYHINKEGDQSVP
jgi:hypothetical protein